MRYTKINQQAYRYKTYSGAERRAVRAIVDLQEPSVIEYLILAQEDGTYSPMIICTANHVPHFLENKCAVRIKP